ncbi:unnamed protein product [Adineta steineri]|uniref:Uncharacterized protein n=1 Tax=Adineta steineri TaxID=433720 RepID=A0A819IC34_9BILA|nr:unnamed protein product [Adineta steineri]
MNEPETVNSDQECSLLKRSHDLEQDFSPKRVKYETVPWDELYENTILDNEVELIYPTSDTEEEIDDTSDVKEEIDGTSDVEEEIDDTSDIEDIEIDSNLSTDQSPYTPVILNQTNLQQQKPSLSSYSKNLVKQFKDIYEHSKRKFIQPTQCIDDNINQIKNLRWELRNTFDRNALFKEGYAVLSDESFPFYSLCYTCGSMGSDIIYCNSCCQAYHTACLNESERPLLCPTPESWLCPNCIVCCICSLLKNSQIITCFECKRNFHIKCIKQTKDEQQNSNFHNQQWFCPVCIKCDCGQALISNERNLLSTAKTVTSQQSRMCSDCLNNMKIFRANKNDKIEKCHLCEKFIEQYITKPKPLFSMTLIGKQTPQKINNLLQCIKCKHHFHPICDGYLNEDVTLITYIKDICSSIICSKCDINQKENIKNSLTNYKLQGDYNQGAAPVVKNTIASITSTLQIIISEENHLNNMKVYMSNLQQLHQSRNQSLNLHAFINDLLIIIQRLLDNIDSRRWQAAIDNCLMHQCPWFKSSNLSSSNKILYCSSTNASISHTNVALNRCVKSPSIDHTYSLNNDRLLFESNLYKNTLLTSSDSLLRYINNKFDEKYTFENLHQIDTRLCQLCQTYADHFSSNISRLISIGINQWVHIGCILPAYTKTLNQPPYILHNVREIVRRCQKKYKCDICSKMGASIQCYENDCHTYFHCQCIEIYYSKFNRDILEKLNIINGLLPNLTTLCSKHNKIKIKNELNDTNQYEINNDRNYSKLKSINLSSTIYADLSNSIVEFSLTNIQLCIGSLQIKSFGNYDYLLDNDTNVNIYPNKYHATRLFWSTKNARQKTLYHLYIDVEQTYHNEKSNHQTIEYPLTNKQIQVEQLYDICEKYFNKFKKRVRLEKTISIRSENSKNDMKQISSHSKCQTSKSALKNRSRPRDRFKNENNSDVNKPLEEKPETIAIDTKTLRSLFTNDALKSPNLSRFARALVQALQHTDQSIPSIKKSEQQPIFSYYLSNQTGVSSNKSIVEKNNDGLLDRLLKSINQSQPLNASQLSSDMRLPSNSAIQTNTAETHIPQIDGSIDDEDDTFLISSSILSSLIEQIIKNEEDLHTNCISSTTKLSFNFSKELIQKYQHWLTSKFGRIKFTIISDDGYKSVSENLDDAWSNVVNLVRECRDDMKLTHLPMTNEELNGHRIFGLTRSIIKIMLNQIYLNSFSIQENTSTIILPLSSNHNISTSSIKKKLNHKKIFPPNSRLNIYQRKNSKRQRFNWLLNPNRKIEYALKSFEIDDALEFARQIILDEPSVSLRLYHLRYFSERVLLVGSSSIHGCGLFTLIDLVEGQMIVEYTGEVIRPCLTDKREYENEKKVKYFQN